MIEPKATGSREATRPPPADATAEWADATAEWNESAALAARRMELGRLESLQVMADGKPIGRVSRRDIERCAHHGNWLEAVMVADLIPEPTDTCT
jgi:hypothetical protein